MIRRFSIALCLVLAVLALVGPVSAQNPPFSAAFTFQDAATAAGNGSAFNVGNFAVVGVQVVKTSSANAVLNFEGKIGASATYAAMTCYPQGSSTGSTGPTSPTGLYRCNTLGITQMRARLASFTGSGTISVYGYGSQLGPLPVDVP